MTPMERAKKTGNELSGGYPLRQDAYEEIAKCYALCYVFSLFNSKNRFYYMPSNFQVQNVNTCIEVEFVELPKFGPDREGSSMCQSGSIASGGTREYCSCDYCF